MKILNSLIVAVDLLQLVQTSYPNKILGYLMTPGRSHFIIHDSLMRGLAAKGHEVTVLGIFPPPTEEIPNYRYIHIPLDEESTELLDSIKVIAHHGAENKEGPSMWAFPEQLRQLTKMMTGFLNHTTVEKLKREEQFDLVVLGFFFNDYQLGIAAHFQCPSVMMVAASSSKFLGDYVGNPAGVAYAPFPMFPVKGAMTFTQRIINFLIVALETVIFSYVDHFVYEHYYTEYFPPDKYPTWDAAKKNVSLLLVGSHFSQGYPIATFPSLVEVSGIQIKKQPDPLPRAIQEFLDSATDGAIFFSFGSNINSAHMSEEKRRTILRVFARLKQKVLWKWEDDNLPGKPDNVMIGKWLPQDDILAHPNVRLFISHCGKGSVNEARYHGVPIFGLPMYGDQSANLEAIMKEGWAIGLTYSDLTEESFEINLKEVLTNGRYRQVVKSAAELYKDRPEHPLDTAVYWVEYVLRHNGAKHMQSQAVYLNWFQYHSLDVIGLFLVVCYISFKLFVLCVKIFFRKCFGYSKVKKE